MAALVVATLGVGVVVLGCEPRRGAVEMPPAALHGDADLPAAMARPSDALAVPVGALPAEPPPRPARARPVPPDSAPVTLDAAVAALRVEDAARHPWVPHPADGGTGAEAVAWGRSLGFTTGLRAEALEPGAPLDRGDAAVLLHRFAGSPMVTSPAFADVAPDDIARYEAVAWLRDVGITQGVTPTAYEPDRTLRWDEFALMLERLADVTIVRVAGSVAHTVVDGVTIADPFIVPVDDGYALYATQERWTNLPVFRSPDLVQWQRVGDALPVLPEWATWGKLWAPDVFEHEGRTYALFSSVAEGTRNHCIGLAVADGPFGVFEPEDEPLLCQHDRGGVIDPRTFVDVDGTLYLHWKSDDNHLRRGNETVMWAQELDDELRLVGPRHRLMGSYDASHLGPIIESPQMVHHDGRYDLTYSAGGGFTTPAQFIGTARCEGPVGPCVPDLLPLIASNDDGPGPGEHSLFRDRDGVLHVAYGPFHDGHLDQSRVLAIAEVREDGEGLRAVGVDR